MRLCFMGNKTLNWSLKIFFLNFISLDVLSTVDKNPFFLRQGASSSTADLYKLNVNVTLSFWE